jgi:phosphoglycerate dehydrogenase-like enzyme
MPSLNRAVRIAVLPPERTWASAAVEEGGGIVADPADAEGLVWAAGLDEAGLGPEDLREALRRHPGIRWVQLPWSGVDDHRAAGVLDHDRIWTSGKGLYAALVAEHALCLTLAGLHELKPYSQARAWSDPAGTRLVGGRVTIFGGGGVAARLVRLLEPFGCRITVVRKHPAPIAGVDRVVGWDRRDDALAADAVILALALTAGTDRFFGRAQLERMDRHAWLVNVARGRHVVTDDLVDALHAGRIGGACLDVTDPEPLPEGHPLWASPNCLITPHSATTWEMAIPLLQGRITENVRRFSRGEPLAGVVDPDLGY